jgi:hypothetical protein
MPTVNEAARKSRTRTDQKAIALAQHVIWLEELHGIKTEPAIADAEQLFGLKRSRVTDILREQRPKWDSLRSAARSDAVHQAYTMMEQERALIEKEDAFEVQPLSGTDEELAAHRLLLERTNFNHFKLPHLTAR